jgi:hypothetical protein
VADINDAVRKEFSHADLDEFAAAFERMNPEVDMAFNAEKLRLVDTDLLVLMADRLSRSAAMQQRQCDAIHAILVERNALQ